MRRLTTSLLLTAFYVAGFVMILEAMHVARMAAPGVDVTGTVFHAESGVPGIPAHRIFFTYSYGGTSHNGFVDATKEIWAIYPDGSTIRVRIDPLVPDWGPIALTTPDVVPSNANVQWAVAVFLLSLPSYILYSRFLTARHARRIAEANRAPTTPPGT